MDFRNRTQQIVLLNVSRGFNGIWPSSCGWCSGYKFPHVYIECNRFKLKKTWYLVYMANNPFEVADNWYCSLMFSVRAHKTWLFFIDRYVLPRATEFHVNFSVLLGFTNLLKVRGQKVMLSFPIMKWTEISHVADKRIGFIVEPSRCMSFLPYKAHFSEQWGP